MMECNKEEAMRAKEIAEKKMESKDFIGAKKIALKAQQLYPGLENISQMIMVCDVHCSADNKFLGNEKDWYGILKVEPSADESTIRKQFRQFALLLHPDKNKFSGAEDAFKLIGEAHRVLLDREKRMLYDSKRRTGGARVSIPNRQSNFTNFSSNSTSQFVFHHNRQPQQQPQQATFWTVCPFCSVRYQFYREVLNKIISCRNCKKSFTGYEVNVQGGAFYQKNDVRNQAPPPPSRRPPPPPKMAAGGGSGGAQATGGSNFDKPVKKNTKKRQRGSESNESCDSGTSIESEDEDDIDFQKVGSEQKSEFVRRSTRSRKQNVSYSENMSDDEDMTKPSVRAKYSSSSHATKMEAEDSSTKEGHCEENRQNGENDNLKTGDPENEPETYHCPDPDFTNFEQNRNEDCFRTGQIWAVYDTMDAMPRFYARIMKVVLSPFKLQITWLEPDPDNEDESKWAEEGLPVSCGKFSTGNSETVDNLPMFSHSVCWEKGMKRNTYRIYPRKGETWAIFKNFDMKWCYDPDIKSRKFEFEFVEVLSDFVEGVGIRVLYLVKVKGFSCLFVRRRMEGGGTDTVLIPAKEIFRFSHRVPSSQMSGEEREDVPRGSIELDPASLPSTGLEEIPLHETSKMGSKSPEIVDLDSNSSENPLNNGVNDVEVEDSTTAEAYEIPEPEFYNFDSDKSIDKIEVGQIWAFYSDEDGLPKYYGYIRKIELQPEFRVQVTWLSPSSALKNVIRWKNKKMLTCCGWFMPRKLRTETYTSTGSFSHQLRTDLTDKKDLYGIFPRKTEVWAMYSDWDAGMTVDDLKDCKYDIVEVLEDDHSFLSVLFLELVDGFKSVFRAKSEENGTVTKKIKIPRVEILRFSHQIPFFRLTDERGGSVRGFLELDPAALPVAFFRSD